MAKEKKAAAEVAEKLVAKMPAAVRGEVTTKPGAGDYVVIRCGGRSIGTARPSSVKVTLPHDGSAAQLAEAAKVLGAAAKAALAKQSEAKATAAEADDGEAAAE